jgi:hypothetical protein
MPRARKPAKLHVLEGTAKQQRLLARVNELDIAAEELGEPPADVASDPEAMQVWKDATEHPAYSAVLHRVNREPFIELCLYRSPA